MALIIEIGFDEEDELHLHFSREAGDDPPAVAPQEYQACTLCSRTIGEEVTYGADWGQGPICDECAEL